MHHPDSRRVTVRLPARLAIALHSAAFSTRRPASAIVEDTLRRVLGDEPARVEAK